MHKVNVHKIKETYENIIIGFRTDIQSYIELLATMDESPAIKKCKVCVFEVNSKGKLQIHMGDIH